MRTASQSAQSYELKENENIILRSLPAEERRFTVKVESKTGETADSGGSLILVSDRLMPGQLQQGDNVTSSWTPLLDAQALPHCLTASLSLVLPSSPNFLPSLLFRVLHVVLSIQKHQICKRPSSTSSSVEFFTIVC